MYLSYTVTGIGFLRIEGKISKILKSIKIIDSKKCFLRRRYDDAPPGPGKKT
jgi:hypothetical protein